ncbi:hypothetical protein GJ496_000342 [Pomphorhynchus laevis]|nr:hypothetical protein GJ496_000342 [Pomphorhynchus laevis]
MPKCNDNHLTIHGNKDSMNLNSLILTNIQSSHYFKINLYELKTYHEVIDEIYNKVQHLEPWEKGSRHTQGLKGMCGGVRGVGGGGIVSTAYCILYKLYTLKLTRKQVMGLTNHKDSPYIRALGFMYIRYTQAPENLLSWFEDYLDDTEELDVKAGGGCIMKIGQMLQQWLTRIEWFDTLFPRIPVPIQKIISARLEQHNPFTIQPPVTYDNSDSLDKNGEHVHSKHNIRRKSRSFDEYNSNSSSGSEYTVSRRHNYHRDHQRRDHHYDDRHRHHRHHRQHRRRRSISMGRMRLSTRRSNRHEDSFERELRHARKINYSRDS